MKEQTVSSFSRGRRTWLFFAAIINTICLLALISLVNYLAAGWHKRFQLSDDARIVLSPQTERILTLVTNPVNVAIVFDQGGEQDLYQMVNSLLREYAAKTPHFKLKSLDYTKHDAETKILLAQHRLNNLKDKNFVFFESEGRTKIVFANELSDYDINSVLSRESDQFRRTHFRGEMLFSAALFSVTYARDNKAYFLTGHGEHDPSNSETVNGYGKVGLILSNEHNVAWATLDLRRTNAVPSDCQLLIVAGQKGKFAESEFIAITNYLQQGGRAFILLNNSLTGGRAGIDFVLTNWNIVSPETTITDEEYSTSGGKDLLTARMSTSHPVTRPLVNDDHKVRLIVPRPLFTSGQSVRGADAPKVDVLLGSSDQAIETMVQQGKPPVTRRGGFPLGLAVEQGSIKGITGDRGTMRLIVVGDSLFLDNEIVEYEANHYFASQAISWLLSRPEFLLEGLGPKPVKDYQIVLTPSQLRLIQVLFLGVFPGTVLVIGLIVWFARRR